MKQEDLDRLEALASAATPGPWKVVPENWSFATPTDRTPAFVVAPSGRPISYEAHAAFIAAAREAVPALIFAVRQAQASEAEAWAKRRLYFHERNEEAKSRIAELEKTIEALQKELGNVLENCLEGSP